VISVTSSRPVPAYRGADRTGVRATGVDVQGLVFHGPRDIRDQRSDDPRLDVGRVPGVIAPGLNVEV